MPEPDNDNADQRAAILETAGTREAAKVEMAGLRDAATLEAGGIRDAATLQAGGERDAQVLQAAGVREETVLMTAGQRATSLLWENTQAKIALIVVAAALLACLTIILSVVYLVFIGKLDSVAIAVLTLVLGVMSMRCFSWSVSTSAGQTILRQAEWAHGRRMRGEL